MKNTKIITAGVIGAVAGGLIALFVIQKMNSKEHDNVNNNTIVNETSVVSGQEEDIPLNALPQFPGGKEELTKFIQRTIVYPTSAKEQNIQGRVICSFIVTEQGNITDIVVSNGIEASLNNEAVRVVAVMPKWTPARENGVAIRFKVAVPVEFKLE